ncbi:ABC transporter permease [uncultured Anaeromusa sp.]|uniref:ABC transporter permease n=1 Tax=uncultured Anaeromusa sp. TaxID=673273 RepID=UPI0029C97FEC|nr:ABC transporter permease [uncultured Anaeromusa sp.]
MQLMLDVFNLLVERRIFFIELLFQHIYLSTIAIVITTIIGVTAGIIMTRHEKLASFIMLIINFVYTIPSIALFGFLVAITGIGSSSALIALVIYGLLPIIRNTYAGIRSVDSEVVESAVAMGSTDFQLLVKVQLPMAMAILMAGFRTMVVMTIALGGIASFIGAGGLGIAIWRGITTNFPQMTVAGSLIVALLALTADLAIGGLEKLKNKKM